MNGTELRDDHRETIEVAALGSLFRAELAASGVYREAIRAIEREAGSPALALHGVGRSHRVLADELRDVLRQRGRPVPLAAGAGGIWSASWERIASVAPGSAGRVLEALQEGERLSLGLALAATEELGEAMAAYVRYRLAPALESNLELLSELRTLEARAEAGPRAGGALAGGLRLSDPGGTGMDDGKEIEEID